MSHFSFSVCAVTCTVLYVTHPGSFLRKCLHIMHNRLRILTLMHINSHIVSFRSYLLKKTSYKLKWTGIHTSRVSKDLQGTTTNLEACAAQKHHIIDNYIVNKCLNYKRCLGCLWENECFDWQLFWLVWELMSFFARHVQVLFSTGKNSIKTFERGYSNLA